MTPALSDCLIWSRDQRKNVSGRCGRRNVGGRALRVVASVRELTACFGLCQSQCRGIRIFEFSLPSEEEGSEEEQRRQGASWHHLLSPVHWPVLLADLTGTEVQAVHINNEGRWGRNHPKGVLPHMLPFCCRQLPADIESFIKSYILSFARGSLPRPLSRCPSPMPVRPAICQCPSDPPFSLYLSEVDPTHDLR